MLVLHNIFERPDLTLLYWVLLSQTYPHKEGVSDIFLVKKLWILFYVENVVTLFKDGGEIRAFLLRSQQIYNGPNLETQSNAIFCTVWSEYMCMRVTKGEQNADPISVELLKLAVTEF